MDRILQAARRRGLSVIEDCAQCAGGEYHGKKAGTIGDAGCFSFSQGKHVSTGGEGGMVVTALPEAARACRSLRDYGREQDGPGPASHVRAGFNYRLSEMQAIVGLNELARLDSWNLSRRIGFASIYDHAFSQLPGVAAFRSTARNVATPTGNIPFSSIWKSSPATRGDPRRGGGGRHPRRGERVAGNLR